MQRDGIPGIANKTLILVPSFSVSRPVQEEYKIYLVLVLKAPHLYLFSYFGPNNYVFQLVPACLIMFTCESFLCVCADLRANSIIQDLGKRILKKIKHKKVWFYLIFLIPCGVTLDY